MLGIKNDILFKLLIAVSIVIIWLSYSISLFKQKSNNNQEIVISKALGSGNWETVSGGLLPDLRRIAFDSSGRIGVGVSLEGYLITSKDGGLTWDLAGKIPLDPDGMEIVNSLAITNEGLFVGTAVDESLYGAIYHLTDGGKWQVQEGNYGGLLNGANNSVMVGSNGLIAKLSLSLPTSNKVLTDGQVNNSNSTNNKTVEIAGNSNSNKQAKSKSGKELANLSSLITLQQLPLWGQINLYSVGQKDEKVLVAGDYGLVCLSTDTAKSWKNISPDRTNKLPFYGASITDDFGLVGGINGSFWRFNYHKNNWQQIVGLKKELTVFAIYADKESCVVGGGQLMGTSPFILYSANKGLEWKQELIPQDYGRIVSVAKSINGVFVATIDGHILIRKNNSK
jgi:photosystem II stability/assembly factor-like uncharacterized protein